MRRFFGCLSYPKAFDVECTWVSSTSSDLNPGVHVPQVTWQPPTQGWSERCFFFFCLGGFCPEKLECISTFWIDLWYMTIFDLWDVFCKCNIDHWVPVGGFASRLGDIGNHRCPQLSWKVLKKSQTRFTCNANMHVYVLKNIWLYIHLVSVEFEWVFK